MQRSILVVDSDGSRRSRLQATLVGIGSRVVAEASDPEEAMRLATMTSPHVAIVAGGPPQADGIHLVGRLATEHGIPTLLLLPPGLPPDIAWATQAGMMGFLVDPVDPITLRAALEVAYCRFLDLLALKREAETLRRSLEARKVIERAKGLLMDRDGIAEQEAFARLRRASMDRQRPMAEVARAVILAAEVNGRSR